ncbi:ribosomal protein L7/L12 [bacterium]|nr:ribosomal protein L7/L12 [bacterium]
MNGRSVGRPFLYLRGLCIMNMTLLYCAFAFMLIIIARDYLKKKYNIDMDNINVKEIKTFNDLKNKFINSSSTPTVSYPVIKKGTGKCSLTLVNAGANKATVMATLRQITGLDYASAKKVVESVPATFMTSISDKEADLTKKALEFVGAKIEIQ